MCIISREDVTPAMTYLTLANTSILYAFPIIFLPFLYTRIALALRESEKLNNQSSNSANPSRSNRRTVVRMQSKSVAFLTGYKQKNGSPSLKNLPHF